MEFEKLCEIIAETMNVDQDELKMETEFVNDLGADSLDIFKITMGMEDVFDMEFSLRKMNQVRTIADVVALICR